MNYEKMRKISIGGLESGGKIMVIDEAENAQILLRSGLRGSCKSATHLLAQQNG